jgi:ketosteroid isomerase-like protein
VQEIIDLERAALARWCDGDPDGFLEISAADVVYFDPFIDRRLDGLARLTDYYEALRGTVRATSFELRDPKVTLAGDAAVLAFNFESTGDGGEVTLWNCTEAYRRDPAGWRIIATHWSLTGPARQKD